MNASKLFLSLLLGASSIAGAWAQHAVKREYFCDPAKYQYRLKSYKHYGQLFTYNYDEKGYVKSLEVTNDDGSLESRTLFYYDEKGYFVRLDDYGRPRIATGEFDIVSRRNDYTRNELGQVVTFSIYQLLGENQDDETLTKTMEGKFTYNEKGLERDAIFTAGIEGTAKWAPFRKCKVVYDAQDRIIKLDQVAYPEEGEKLMDEVFEYNDRGQITKLGYNSYTGNRNGELIFKYDNQGNLLESGDPDFPVTYTYENKSLKCEKVFFPIPPIARSLYYEFRNNLIFSLGFPFFYTLPTTAPTKEVMKMAGDDSEDEDEDEGMFVYETVPMSNVLIPIVENNLKPTIAGGCLSVVLPSDLVGQAYYLCNAEGVLLQGGIISSEDLALEVSDLPHGTYLLKVGSQIAKILL